MGFNVGLIARDADVEADVAAILKKTSLTVWTSRSPDAICDNVARPGTLLLAVALPDLSGLELVERLRALHVDVPAILIGPQPNALPAKRLADASVLDVIPLPVGSRDLLSWIECVCVTRLVLHREQLLKLSRPDQARGLRVVA